MEWFGCWWCFGGLSGWWGSWECVGLCGGGGGGGVVGGLFGRRLRLRIGRMVRGNVENIVKLIT